MNRRRLASLGLGAAAAMAGAATWWLNQRESLGDSAAVASLWSRRFPRPGGGEVEMAQFAGRPLLINFWATWCAPCVREMPEINRFAREFAPNGWQVLGLAVDQENPVREFLIRQPVDYPIALAGFDGVALGRTLGNEGGGLPYTVAFDATGSLRHRHVGEARFADLAAWVRTR